MDRANRTLHPCHVDATATASSPRGEAAACSMTERILTVKKLRVDLPVPAGMLHAVQGVSFMSIAARRCASSANPVAARR